MNPALESVRMLVLLQVFFNLVLMALFYTLYTRFRRNPFYWWWSWAWGIHALALAAGQGALELGAALPWVKGFLQWVNVAGGFLQFPLLIIGMRSFERPPEQRSLWHWMWVGLAMAGGTAVFGASLSPQASSIIVRWFGYAPPGDSPMMEGLPAFALRAVPRQLVMGLAYLYCGWAFLTLRRRIPARAAVLAGTSCATLGAYMLFQGWYMVRMLVNPAAPPWYLPAYVFDITCQMALAFGLALMLLEEYRRVVESRAEVETRFGGMAESLGSGLLITDPEDRILYVNSRMAEMTGYTLEEMNGQAAYRLFLPEKSWPGLWEKNRRRMEGLAERYEIEIRRKDGAPVWVEVTATPYRNVSGEVVGTLGSVSDITERRRIQEALRISEERFATAFRASPDAITITRLADGRYVDVNEGFVRLSGYARAEVIGQTTLELGIWVNVEEREEVLDLVKRTGAARDLEILFRRKSGEALWCQFSGELIELGGEKCLLGISRDISDRKHAAIEQARAAEALRESEERYRMVAQTATDAILTIDETSRILFVNPAAEKIFGHSVPEMLGQNLTMLMPEYTRHLHRAGLHRYLETGRRHISWEGIELPGLHKNGREVPLEVSFGEVEKEGRRFFTGIVRDITERKRAERLQAAVYRIAEAADKAPTLEDLYRAVHAIVGEVMPADNFYIALYNEPANLLSFPYFVDEQDQASPPAPPGKGNTAWVLRHGQALLSTTAVHEEMKARGEVETIGPMSPVWLGVPLKIDEKTIGVMAVQHYSDEQAYGEREQHMLEYVSGQVATAIERKQVEQALRQSEAKFSQAFHASPDAMVISSQDESRFLEVNESFLGLTGYQRAEVLGHTSLELDLWVHPEKRAALTEAVRRAGRVTDHEFELRTRSGQARTGLLSVDKIEVGGKACFLSSIRDITERKQVEQALRLSEEKFSKAFFSSPDAVLISVLDAGRFIEVNEGFLRMSGYTREEVLGSTGLELNIWTNPRDRERVLEELRRSGNVRNRECEFRSKRGEVIAGLLAAEIIEFAGQRCMLVQVRDITERKRMETALRENQRVLSTLMGNLPGMAYRCHNDERWTMTFASEGCLALTGHSPGDFTSGKVHYGQLVHADDHLRDWPSLQQAITARRPFEMEYRIIAADGTEKWVWERGQGVYSPEGELLYLEGFISDITARRQAEAALHHSEERYRELIENANDLVYTHDLQGSFTSLNRAGERITGYSREEALRMNIQDMLPPEQLEFARSMVAAKLAGKGPTTYEIGIRSKDGRALLLEVSTRLVYLAGKPAAVQGIARDVTERRRAEEALKESEAKFRVLAESSPSMILIAVGDHLVFANRAAEQVTGYSREELSGRNLWSLVAPESLEAFAERRRERLAGQMGAMRYEVKMATKTGAKWLDLTTTDILYEGQPAVLGNAVDITERKLMEEQFRQAQKMEAVGRLAGGVAHDFNNLLMIVRGYTELLLDSGELSPGLQRNAEQIAKAAERASGLTHQLLAFSRKQVLAPQVLDLNTVVAGVDKMLHRLIGEDIELVTRPCAGLWHVKADPGQLEQVLLNLAINARDAMPRGGRLTLETRNVELDARFVRHHSGSRPGQHVLLTVSDNGAGMPPDVRSRIFEPFFTTKEVGRGTGLGLATVYGIVKQSNGYITVESEPGQGTTFHIYLPRAEEELLPAVESRERATVAGGTETILLVEDQQDVRALACEFLGRQGYRVLEARSGPEALQVSGQHAGEIHVLVTDVIMPGMSGRELVDQLAPARPQMKVLYVSGYTDEAIGKHGILEPGTEFLQKPFSRESLARKLRDMLDNGG